MLSLCEVTFTGAFTEQDESFSLTIRPTVSFRDSVRCIGTSKAPFRLSISGDISPESLQYIKLLFSPEIGSKSMIAEIPHLAAATAE